MSELFVVREPVHGMAVRLDSRQWYRHILWEHEELTPRLHDVAETVSRPDLVLRSKYRGDTWLYHKLLPDRRRYMCVAVRLVYNDAGERREGFM